MHGTVVVITGASGGIGAAAAKSVVSRGASVALLARRETELHAVAEECGPNAMPIVADATSRDDVRRAARAAIDRFGHVDVWVNNVGRGITRLPTTLSDDDVDEMMRVNVKSALYGIQEILPHFKQRGSGQIINVSSMLGRMPMAPFRSAYNGAKHFLNALTWNIRDELREAFPGIIVSLVSPPVVATEFGVNAKHGGPDSRSLPSPQDVTEVGEVIAWVIETKKLDVYTRPGSKAVIAQFFSRIGEDPPAEVLAGQRTPA
jgi:NAD(P)-dependent dehydrogenase (short-subunit alcohol dehydrogenase family)